MCTGLKKRLVLPAVLFLLALLPALCLAEEALDVAKKCGYETSVGRKNVKRMWDGSVSSAWNAGEKGTLTVTLPKGSAAQGIMVTFFCDPPRLTVTDADGSPLASWDEGYYVAWIPFAKPSGSFTLARDGGGDLLISRLSVLTEGYLPDWVQRWHRMEGAADLLMIVTHPDDDLLWFGGMLPTYAGERGMKVQVAYMVAAANRTRRVELLDALWHCGVRDYPSIGAFPDKGVYSVKAAYRNWGGEDHIQRYLTGLVRQYQPRVVVLQDLNGEYGHIHHKITSRLAVKAATELCGDPSYDPESAEKWGIAAPQKVYVHLYKENQMTFDWDRPLDAFGGKTSLEIAREAFKLHVSQQKGKYHVSTKGATRCTLFGLCYTTVGPDSGTGDLFEHLD